MPDRRRPSFGLSRWSAPGDEVFGEWQRRVAAGRIGAAVDRRAANAAADAWARVVLGPRARGR